MKEGITNLHAEIAVERIGLESGSLKGRGVVITGAGQGIGREVARAFAWLGAFVVITEISDAGQETEQIIRQQGGEALFVPTDISDAGAVAHMAEQTRQACGSIDILINNAILCPVSSVLDMEVEMWDRVMAVNLRGTFLTVKNFLPSMLERGRGMIVNMVSTDAMPNLSAYIASKQGIAAFSQSLAAEMGQIGAEDVHVIAFAPGFVDTPGLRRAAKGLAPGFGLSEEAFLHLPMHADYTDAPMPADHAAAATAYLVLKLADEYHGEIVNGYTVLERAGFISATGPITAVEMESRVVEDESDNGPTDAGVLSRLVENCEKLSAVVIETGAEFNQLPFFARPLARAGFKNKSGQSLQDWEHTLKRLASQLRQAQDSAGVDEGLCAQAQRLNEMLSALSVYYREVPAETARFTKDEQVLQRVRQLSEARLASIQAVGADLQKLIGEG